ncbi:MAG: S41 family peptidase [Psychroflexus salarius]|jgi:carboxyl-terminal processing protease
MNNSTKIYLPIIIAIAVVSGMYLGQWLNYPEKAASTSANQKFSRFINYIDQSYVDEVNTDSLVEVSLQSILKQLDPHSTYISSLNYDQVQAEMRGDFVGIGISFFTINDTIAVINTIPDGPSDLAGILPGDRIVSANNKNLITTTTDSIFSVLKGKPNTQVNLKVKRANQKRLLDFSLQRKRVPLKSVDAGFMLNDSLGYIKLNRFSETTYSEFKAKLNQLQPQNPKGIIIDLRNNGGGYMKEATDILDEFLSDETLMVFTKNKDGQVNKRFATSSGAFEDTSIYVLINEKTASASEVIAGAIQDNDRGLIIGRRSFGKGLVQREMKLGDGSAVRLTVARYYTPTGRSIQRPYDAGTDNYYDDYQSRYVNGEMKFKDSISVNKNLQYKTPKGKIVYGGGGIIPDVFVPIKDTQTEKDIKFMFEGGVMSRFMFNQLDQHRDYYNALSENEFLSSDLITYEMIEDFENYLGDFSMSYDFDSSIKQLKIYLKATMAQQLFDDNLANQIIVDHDLMIKRLLQLKSN